jgi:hypothetical protein
MLSLSGLRLGNNDVAIGALDNRSQFSLLGRRNLELSSAC